MNVGRKRVGRVEHTDEGEGRGGRRILIFRGMRLERDGGEKRAVCHGWEHAGNQEIMQTGNYQIGSKDDIRRREIGRQSDRQKRSCECLQGDRSMQSDTSRSVN